MHMADEPHENVHLTVLPHSGKVEQLKHETSHASSPAPTGSSPAPTVTASTPEAKLLEGRVIDAMRQVYDPEIPVNIYELGLIYAVDISPEGYVKVKMTLTAPGCPVAGTLPGEVAAKIKSVEGVSDAEVELVWEPSWDKSRMSESALLELGMM
jgi:FeS assembly SUF system protein